MYAVVFDSQIKQPPILSLNMYDQQKGKDEVISIGNEGANGLILVKR
jgi:hypothetical protein